MSDEEEESLSEAFSASEDDWKPTKDARGGESSDDDDSEFEDAPVAAAAGVVPATSGGSRKREPKGRSAVKQDATAAKKRKPMGQSLRSKLYNKYRPPPKTVSSPTNRNSPSASTSRTASKNYAAPNESSDAYRRDDSSSESSVEDYLVNPADIDFQSSFFNADGGKAASPAPVFDCNAGMAHLSDSDSEDNKESSGDEKVAHSKAFDFRNLLEKANSLERVKETIAKRAAQTKTEAQRAAAASDAMDVNTLLALGEMQKENSTVGFKKERRLMKKEDDDDEDDDNDYDGASKKKQTDPEGASQRLSKSKSTRVKRRQAKTRPASTVIAGDSDDSLDWEEVADGSGDNSMGTPRNPTENLEIHVELPTKRRGDSKQLDLELAFRRKLNRDLKERQLLLHKTSLLCCFARSQLYNRLLNDNALMQAALKMLPSTNAYPAARGTEVKYFQSLMTWFLTAVNLQQSSLYSTQTAKNRAAIKADLLSQIERKQPRCKQDMIFIFVILLRGMGLQCRLVVNMQPLPIKPAQSDLLTIKLKPEDGNKKNVPAPVKPIVPMSVAVQTIKKVEPKTKEREEKSAKGAKLNKSADLPPRQVAAPSRTAPKRSLRSESLNPDLQQVKKQRESPSAGPTVKKKARKQPTKAASKTSEALPGQSKTTENISLKVTTDVRDESTETIAKKGRKRTQPNQDKVPAKTAPTSATVRLIAEHLPIQPKASVNVAAKRILRSRQKDSKTSESDLPATAHISVPQLDGADDTDLSQKDRKKAKSKPQLSKLQKSRSKDSDSDSDFKPSPPKRPKVAPVFPKAVQQLRKDRRVLSTDDDDAGDSKGRKRISNSAADMWAEVWSDVEEQWVCVDLFKGKVNNVEAIRKSASSNFAYVFAFQNDLSIKDVTARYCPHWTLTVRKGRVEKAWLDTAIAPYTAPRTQRDIREDLELRRIHEEKPMPTTISEFKDHPLYVLERHLLKFQGIYPPDAPTLGFVRSEPIYARECVHTLHSREIWLKTARTVKLGEQPYKIVKARPKWDRHTQTVIKDQPLEIFGYWQTEDYDPPTAENGLVPRNAYGNVELFKECMLPKKTVHIRLAGLNRVCKKLGIDCANAVIGFDFHQGACHPTYDGFVVCEEFLDVVTAAWYQDQEEQERKQREKYEARVYGNWKKLVRGLFIREHLKKKYNF